MEKEKLIITVSGRAMSGKSRLSFLLKKFLRENGFDVKHEVSLDYQNENQFERQMSKNFDEVIGQMKEQREILIKEEQLKRFNMEKLTKEQEERVEKFWDKAKLNDLVTSNADPYLVEHHLFSTLSLEDETEFLVKSKELGVLKNVYQT
jgi:CO dehydrogenase nickel-insertion accessory protein CooC1